MQLLGKKMLEHFLTIYTVSLLVVFLIFKSCMSLVFFLHVYVHSMVFPISYGAEGSIESPGAGVRDGCVLPCWCWELKPDPM